MDDNHPLLPDLLRWSESNAVAMAAVTLATAAGAPLSLLSLSGLLSFSLLLYRCRRRWTPAGRFGLANGVSLLRLAGMFVLPWLLLYRLPEGFGAWILLPGVLRYLFVLFVKFARPPEPKEQRSAKARWISFFMMLTLLLSFAAYPGYLDYIRSLAVLMTLALAYSFAVSVHLMYRAPRRREKA